ncbi:MAG: Rid family hydrolase [Candidatus Brocadiia bacterium]|jgi:enamine deaminase RidA (YjgF/YER057c/UK114 family)
MGNVVIQREAARIHTRSVVEDLAHVTASVAGPSGDAARASEEIYTRISDILARRRMQVTHERIFGSLKLREPILEARRRALERSGQGADWPTTFIEGRPPWGDGLAGVQIQAVRPKQAGGVRTITDDGVARGRRWQRNGATYLMLQDLHGAAPGSGRESQTTAMFELANRILELEGATYRDVARTWIYLPNILQWYDGFNAARSVKYREFGLLPVRPAEDGGGRRLPPASTGISGGNPHGAGPVMDLLAVIGNPECPVKVDQMTNARQKDAFEYGSAFSRGVWIREPDMTQVQVSGTAAIDERGKSLFPNDCRAQIFRTFDTIEALIAPAGASLKDICQATVFLKRPQDLPVYRQAAAERGLADLPAVCMVADVCRDDLLFEVDATVEFARR